MFVERINVVVVGAHELRCLRLELPLLLDPGSVCLDAQLLELLLLQLLEYLELSQLLLARQVSGRHDVTVLVVTVNYLRINITLI